MTRPTAAQRGYGSRWRKARATYLARNPHCRMCARDGRQTVAVVVDHIEPHRGDQAKFWDTAGNWQGLCQPHHDQTKRQIECHGYSDEIGADGLPTDPRHPFNRPD
ncbi:HNH endonuclease signature motif containing protein [Methylobacterium sp. WL6]|uniref:HNH endonuclease signature motif containing protein n=1 Tax=Methylobacterium sp. WL6 TaxID=2603901 RepID=UPI001FED7983|nr:HNH endonuclease signature motif containing protein [Methylobacterium sp. WL6]